MRALLRGRAGTTCNQRIERIEGTQHAKILRVPFRSKAGILRKWISRRALPHTLQGLVCGRDTQKYSHASGRSSNHDASALQSLSTARRALCAS